MQENKTYTSDICSPELVMNFLDATQKAAISSAFWIGRGNKNNADSASTEALRTKMNQINMNGVIVIGEGELDEAPMLYINEKIGTGKGPRVDIAVDPIDGTSILAKGQDNTLCVIAGADQGCLLHAPDMYMKKIAVGPKAKGYIDIKLPLNENISAVAKALEKDISDLTVMIQDRPRHEGIISAVINTGARVRLFSDVDITGVIATAFDDINVDIFIGTGGAPEGVIAATALKCLGGDFQAQLLPQSQYEYDRCVKMGIEQPDNALTIDDIVKTDNCFFVATGITDGMLLKGVIKKENNIISTHSLIVSGGNYNNYQFVESTFFKI